MQYFENINNTSVIHRVPGQSPFVQGDLEFNEVVDVDEPVIEQAINYYSEILMSSHKALAFLKQRGITDTSAISAFRLGFSDRTLGLRLQALGRGQEEVSRGALQRSGLCKPSGHEFFRGALVFPFFNNDGRIVGAYGRRITPKLKASSVYHVHWFSEGTLFFNGAVINQYDQAILCKTPLEALVWWCAGFKHAFALMAHRAFSATHLQALKRSNVKELFIAFGSSQSELAEYYRIARELNKVGISSRFVLYPNGMDASSFSTSVNSPESAFSELLDRALQLPSLSETKH
jgi:DNA primase